MQEFSISLSKIINELSLDVLYEYTPSDEILITSREINRPGLELTGFLDYFDKKRIMVMGNTEHAYLAKMSKEQRFDAMDKIFAMNPPAVIIARGIRTYEEVIETAKMHHVTLLHSPESTSSLVGALVSTLNSELAPRITRHGVFVEVYGEGILLTGDSGIGKSETAIELVKRGHRLIADDAVEIRKLSRKLLVGSSPENIRHFIEVRGVGIINARRLFGMGSVKLSGNIDIVINLENWNSSKPYDRIGLESQYVNILDVEVPVITVPVKPGRNLAVIIETAAMNNRQKKMGYNAAFDLLSALGMEVPDDSSIVKKQFDLDF